MRGGWSGLSLAESKGGGCSDVLPKRRRKERCSSREACLQSAVGRSKKSLRPLFCREVWS